MNPLSSFTILLSMCCGGMCRLTVGDLEERCLGWWGKGRGRENVRAKGGVNILVVWRHWGIVVQTEGFQEQDEVSEILVYGCSELFNGLTGFVGEIGGAIPMRDMN